MNFRRPVPLRDKVVIVTGASSGIGRAAAHAFAAHGAHVVLTARRANLLQELADELRAYPVAALVAPGDLADDASLERVVAEARRAFSRIDVLVNDAALGYGGALVEMTPDDLHAVLRVNLHGTFRLTQLVLPAMLEQGSGHVVNVSSFAARWAMPGVSVYSATKAGIHAFSNCLRRELAGSGVSVSTVLAGITRTPLIANAVSAFPTGSVAPPWVLELLMRGIYEPEAPARVIVDVVRYRKRQVTMGGLPVALMVALDAVWPGLLDWVFAHYDVRLITSLTEKLGKR